MSPGSLGSVTQTMSEMDDGVLRLSNGHFVAASNEGLGIAQDLSGYTARDNDHHSHKRTHHRTSTAVRIVDLAPSKDMSVVNDDSTAANSDRGLSQGQAESPDVRRGDQVSSQDLGTPDQMSSPQSGTTKLESKDNSSSDASKIPGKAHMAQSDAVQEAAELSTQSAKPDVLSYLDPDSPEITQERIQEAMLSPDPRRPSTPTTGRSHMSDPGTVYANESHKPALYDLETNPRSNYDTGYSPSFRRNARSAHSVTRRQRSYGTPEMPRGDAYLPHISPEALTPRVPRHIRGHSNTAKHLPRAEKLPLTGYEQLAVQLTSHGSDRPGPAIRPMYRRFEMLNHRLLLHLQDELCELEEQLHRLDTADTQNRCLQNGLLPASRRTETMAGGELQWHKTDILGKIGYKLEQYNRVLSSFQTTASLRTPTLADVHEYRGYLATHTPIVEGETQFLDMTEDLVCVGPPTDSEESEDEQYINNDGNEDDEEEVMATPMPRDLPAFKDIGVSDTKAQPSLTVVSESRPRSWNALTIAEWLAIAALCIIAPMLLYVIPPFSGRVCGILLFQVAALVVLAPPVRQSRKQIRG